MTASAASVEAVYDPRYHRFVDLFNRGRYFEAHEILEGLWRKTTDETRHFYQALIQVAAVFLKLREGQRPPANRLADRALHLLLPYPARYNGLDVHQLREVLRMVTQPGPATSAVHPPRLELYPLCD